MLFFLSFCGLSFHFFDSVHWYTKYFNLSPIYLFTFVTCAFGVISKKALPNQGHEDLLLHFLLRVCSLVFTFKPTIHFNFLCIVQKMVHISFSSMWISNCHSTIYCKGYLFLIKLCRILGVYLRVSVCVPIPNFSKCYENIDYIGILCYLN